MERETGFEPATSTLARSHSTAELFPLSKIKMGYFILVELRGIEPLTPRLPALCSPS